MTCPHFGRYSKNKYFGYLLTNKNLMILLTDFSLSDLKLGIKYADEVIYKRVNMTYLKKTIQTGINIFENKASKSLEKLYKSESDESTSYTFKELQKGFERAKEDGLDLSSLKLKLLIKTLEYGEYL